ncbi:MAG: response regulator transcription factor [Flavobacterium sp.]|uniref:response regulator n=1 Tax=Flavobacterium sp. TaxID=239 RepID=UPI0026058E48|nr:response regulator transcription factor [Flavobacterium sp.]MDD5151976.1 response regulator transcription factor [Flavobacterium sp.]
MSNVILIVDDHLVVRTGISMILEEHLSDVKIITAKNYLEAISVLKNNSLSLIILDINIPGGKNREMIQEIRSFQPDVKILIFSANDSEDYACQYILAGANGFLNKQSDEELIVKAIYSILIDGNFVTPDIIKKIIKSNINKTSINPFDTLSERELQISELLVSGEGNLEIANKLDIKASTVSTYKSRVFR